MFSALTTNASFYVFSKGEQPKLEIGQVVSVSKPRPNFQSPYPQFGQPMDMIIDLAVVRIGEEEVKFEALPCNTSLHTYNNGNVVVSDSRESILSEIENAKRTSTAILDSIGYHENMVNKCDEFRKMLNPDIAENEKRDLKLGKLESDLAELKQMLSAALNK